MSDSRRDSINIDGFLSPKLVSRIIYALCNAEQLQRAGSRGLLTLPLSSLIGDTAMRILDEQEKAIIRHLIRDPRESDNGVGELTGVNVRTVSRKRQRLEQEGILSYYANVDLSANGAHQFTARHLYIIKFGVGITYKQLVDDIKMEPSNTVFTERVFESHIAEIDGKVALLLYIDGDSDVDIVQRMHEELIPTLMENHGKELIEEISTVRILSPVRVMRNYLPLVNMKNGLMRPDWPDEAIYVGR
jgi:DNA-binding Lrp family transcriptional regulator